MEKERVTFAGDPPVAGNHTDATADGPRVGTVPHAQSIHTL